VKLGEHRVVAADGRVLATCEWGAATGLRAFNLHGTPGSRFGRAQDESIYERVGVRVITYDRPGYGASARARGRRVADAAADVTAIADALELDRFAVIGVSGGGPHALACAALLGERVLATAVIVPIGPARLMGRDAFLAGQAPDNVDEYSAAYAGEAALASYLEHRVADVHHDAVAAVPETGMSDSDHAVLEDQTIRDRFTEVLLEAVVQGAAGWIDDDLAFVGEWGFDPAAITSPVLLVGATGDTLAPDSHTRALAALMPAALVRFLDGGHLTPLLHLEDTWSRLAAAARDRLRYDTR
jgi:pimeloyl-ACP methyl ester carboxylesterase